jgi:hypothetical protein
LPYFGLAEVGPRCELPMQQSGGNPDSISDQNFTTRLNFHWNTAN